MAAAGGTTTALVMGGFLCLGLVLLAIAATIILSLISIFTANHSEQGYGEEYRLSAMMLKFLYTNGSVVYFSNGTVAPSTDFSNYGCTQLIRSGYKNIYGCVLQNGVAWGPYNASNLARRRRRADVTVGAYLVTEGRIFFSTKCPKTADVNKTQNDTTLSSCVKQRLAYCNSLVNDNTATASFDPWAPTPSFTLYIYDSQTNSYQPVAPSMIYGVPRSVAGAIGNSLHLDSTTLYYLNIGCTYEGGLSISAIDAIIAAAASQTTTTPATSTIY